METYLDFIRYDITFCGDKCENANCERHISHVPPNQIYSMSMFKGTEFCPLSLGHHNNTVTEDSNDCNQ